MDITVQYLRSKTNKSGRTIYWWEPSAALRKAGWEAVPYGDDERAAVEKARKRNAEVEAWRAGAPAGGEQAAPPRRIVRPATLSALVDRFRSERWPSVKQPGKSISAATRKDYASKFRTLEAWAGDLPIAAIDRAAVALLKKALMKPAARGRWKGQVRHTAAHATLRVGHTLFKFAELEGLIPKGANPFAEFGLSRPDPRDHIWWAPAREALLAVAEADGEQGGPMMALAVDLAFSIGQREADLLRLPLTAWQEVPPYKIEDLETYALLAAVPVPAYGGRPACQPGNVMGIRLRTSKTRRWVEVPIVGLTRARLEWAIERAKAAGCTTLLIDEPAPGEAGAYPARPWTAPNPEAGQRRFIRRFAALREAAIHAQLRRYADSDDEAGLELALEMDELQYRDFRRTAVVYQGELGIADHLIAAITAHSLDETKKILDTYLPRTTGMAARAIALSHARAAAPGALRSAPGAGQGGQP